MGKTDSALGKTVRYDEKQSGNSCCHLSLVPPGLMFPPSLLAAPALPCLAWGIGTGVCVQHRAAPSPSRDPRAPGPVFSRAVQGFRCSTMICWGAESHRPDCWKVYCNFPGVLTSRVQIVFRNCRLREYCAICTSCVVNWSSPRNAPDWGNGPRWFTSLFLTHEWVKHGRIRWRWAAVL